MKIRLKIQKTKEYHCKIHVQQRQTQEPWAFSIYVALPIVWLWVCQTPSHTGPVLSKCTKGVFISSARAAQHGVYYTGEIPSLQECVASLEGWKAPQQNTTESRQSEILVKPVVNEFTHRRRVLTSSTSREFLLARIQAFEFFLIFTIMKEKCNCVVMLW